MFIPNRRTTLPLWLNVIIILICSMITMAQPRDFIYHICDYTANYTRNSTYERNLDATLSALPTTNSGLGYFNRSISQGNDTINSFALCRGDVNPDVCSSCLNDSIVKLRQVCPNQKGAIGYYDYCLLVYFYQDSSENTGVRSRVYFFNRRNATNIDRFNGYLRPLFSNLTANAAAGGPLRKFAIGNTTWPDFSTIYALVQCVPSLSKRGCIDCLEDVINQFALSRYNGRVGGRTLIPTCNFRYEIYRFSNVSTLVITPPPSSPAPPNSQASPPVLSLLPGGSTTSTIVMIIVIVAIAIVIVIIPFICIFTRLRKRKQPPSTEAVERSHCSNIFQTPNGSKYWVPEVSVDQKPFVGAIFTSWQQVLDMYQRYAQSSGFVVRVGGFKRWNGVITHRTLLRKRF